MARHRNHPIAFKRQIVQEHLAGDISLNGIAKQHESCRHLLRVWVEKCERGEYADEMEGSALSHPTGRALQPWSGWSGASRARTSF